MTAVQVASKFRGFTEYPALAYTDQGAEVLFWLNHLNEREYEVLYTTNQPGYKEWVNRITASDYVWGLESLPLFWGIGVLALLIGVKWIVLPALYLLGVLLLREALYYKHERLHFWLAVSMYLLVKVLLIGDVKKPVVLEVMPAFMQHSYVFYLTTAIVFLFSYGWTLLRNRRVDDGNPGTAFAYLVGIDIFTTILWYSYFLSPV